MSERGVFALDRGIWDHPSFANEPLTEREAWAWLISEASFKSRTKRIGSAVVNLGRGQVAASLRFMASKWQWSEPRVRRFLKRLKTDAMIDAATDAGITIITICNYDKYQKVSLPRDAATDALSDAAPTQQRRKVESTESKEVAEAKASASPKRATRLPADAQPSQRNIVDALDLGLNQSEIDQQWRRMRDWSASAPKGACLDWNARWRNWCETYLSSRTRAPPATRPENAYRQSQQETKDLLNDLENFATGRSNGRQADIRLLPGNPGLGQTGFHFGTDRDAAAVSESGGRPRSEPGTGHTIEAEILEPRRNPRTA